MTRAQVLTHWIGDGRSPETAFRPAVLDDHPVREWRDVTGSPQVPTAPNAVVVEVVCEVARLDDIAADPRHGPGAVLVREGRAGDVAAVRERLAGLGFSPAQTDEALGPAPEGRGPVETVEQLTAWLRARPQAVKGTVN
jgi:hypothetical protein